MRYWKGLFHFCVKCAEMTDTRVNDSEKIILKHILGGIVMKNRFFGEMLVQNGSAVNAGSFAGTPMSEQEEMANLTDALYNGDSLFIDEHGIISLNDDVSGEENGTVISSGTFAGERLTEAEEFRSLADALYNQSQGDPSGIVIDHEGIIHLEDDLSGVENGQAISGGIFAAGIPTNPDQWYNKNPRLFRAEVAAMHKAFPKAAFGFYQETGNMFWTVSQKISQTGFTKEWTFILRYDKDHPHNHTYGGSIKVFPIKPSIDDMKEMLREFGRPGIPHLLSHETLGTYLCTRRTEDVEAGTTTVSSAAQVAGWAADWAIHFEIGLRDKNVWNKWCDDEHFRHYMIP